MTIKNHFLTSFRELSIGWRACALVNSSKPIQNLEELPPLEELHIELGYLGEIRCALPHRRYGEKACTSFRQRGPFDQSVWMAFVLAIHDRGFLENNIGGDMSQASLGSRSNTVVQTYRLQSRFNIRHTRNT